MYILERRLEHKIYSLWNRNDSIRNSIFLGGLSCIRHKFIQVQIIGTEIHNTLYRFTFPKYISQIIQDRSIYTKITFSNRSAHILKCDLLRIKHEVGLRYRHIIGKVFRGILKRRKRRCSAGWQAVISLGLQIRISSFGSYVSLNFSGQTHPLKREYFCNFFEIHSTLHLQVPGIVNQVTKR